MKTFGRSYDLLGKILERSNFDAAFIEASKGKERRYSVLKAFERRDELYEKLVSGDFVLGNFKRITVTDVPSLKKRNILIPPFFPDQIWQHMVFRIIGPVLERSRYFYSASGCKGKGTLFASMSMRRFMREDEKHTKYCASLDIRKFYENIDHGLLMDSLKRKITDPAVLDALKGIIDSGQKGLPIGCYSSQILANFFLSGLDHFIKEKLRMEFYVRYADNMIVMSSNKKVLANAIAMISKFLNSLKLELHGGECPMKVAYKSKSWTVKGSPVDFVGYRHSKHCVTIRKRNFVYARRSAIRAKAYMAKHKGRLALCMARTLQSRVGQFIYSSSRKAYADYMAGMIEKAKAEIRAVPKRKSLGPDPRLDWIWEEYNKWKLGRKTFSM
jgi:RNA-directed DNA polymerase